MVLQVQVERSWQSLESAPEWFLSLFHNVVCGKRSEKLVDLMVEHVLEQMSS